MPASWKTVRVFISSTFRDMHAERDWLVQQPITCTSSSSKEATLNGPVAKTGLAMK
jgi:hypothetical protein